MKNIDKDIILEHFTHSILFQVEYDIWNKMWRDRLDTIDDFRYRVKIHTITLSKSSVRDIVHLQGYGTEDVIIAIKLKYGGEIKKLEKDTFASCGN